MRTYKKPVVSVDAGMTEGVYAASGAAQGTLNVTYIGVWDKWGTNGGKGHACYGKLVRYRRNHYSERSF